MTDKAELKQETKRQMRALLLSAPAGLTVRELTRDYHEFIGEQIPFRPLGYTTLEDFIRDIPDVLQVFYKNGVMCIKAVADETTKHIEKLVSKQKVSNKNKWAILRKGGPQAPRRNNYRPPRPPPGVPAYIRKRIIELFKSYPEHGLPLTHFEPAFSQRFGMQLSFSRIGFSSLRDLLSSIPDIVKVQNFGGEYRVIPVHPHWYNNCNNNSGALEPEEETWTPAVSEIRQQSQTTLNTQEKSTCAPRGRGRKRSGYTEQKSLPDQINRQHSDPDSSKLDKSPETEQYDEPVDTYSDQNSNISVKLQEELTEILEGHPDGIWASKLPMIFKDKYKKELSVTEQGYWSVIEFCSSLPNIIRIERPTLKGDWLLFDARLPKVELPKETGGSPKDNAAKTSTIDEAKHVVLKETLRQVLQCYPSGVSMNDLPTVYKNLTGEDIPVEEMGFRSLAKYLISLDDSILNIKYIGAGCIMVSACSNGEVRKTDLLKQLPRVQEVHKVNRLVPEDVVGPGTHYTAVDLPNLYEYSEVYVSNIVSPAVFWFQLIGKRTTTSLEKVMDELERVYKSAEGESYIIPDELLVIGLSVAAIFPEDDNWHRCTITGLHTGHLVEVYFVDYGNTSCIHKNNVRFLKSKLLKLPAQGIQGRLANIQPMKGKWTIEARNRMLSVCKNKALIAMPTAEKDRVISLCLTDTSDRDVDVHLNDLLVNEGYAVMVPDTTPTELGYPQHSEVPDYGCIYGPNVFPVQDVTETPAATNTEQKIEQTPTGRRYIQEIQLCDRVMHIFNIDGTGYMVSREVSGLFWDADVVTSMLELKKASSRVRKSIVSKAEYPELFEEYKQYHQNEVDLLSLFELTSVPYIIELFAPDADDISEAILEVIQNFDPESIYWKDEDGDTDSTTQSEDYTHLNIEELKLTLQALQFKRKRILQTMLINPTEGIVNELNSVEDQIAYIKENVEDMQARRALGPETECFVAKTDKAKSAVNITAKKEEEKFKQKPASSTGAQIKLNVVAPMQNTESLQKVQPVQSSSISGTVPSVAPSVENLMNNMAQQQMMYQSMLMSRTMPGLNPQLFGTPALSPQLNQQFMTGQPMPGLNPQLMMQASMMTPFLQDSLTPQYVPPRQTLPTFPGMGRGSNRQDNMTLLPCLLPLLQNLNMDSFCDQNQNPASEKTSHPSNDRS